jgi:hypothetical protein
MRGTKWLAVPLLYLVVAAWPQQSSSSAPAQTTPASPAQDAHGKNVNQLPPCPAEFGDSLESDGIVGADIQGVTPPKIKRSFEAEFSDEARRELQAKGIDSFQADSVLSLVVGRDGKPQSLCLKQAAGYGLDLQAAKAAWKYIFTPATKDGKNVAMRISVSLHFNWY